MALARSTGTLLALAAAAFFPVVALAADDVGAIPTVKQGFATGITAVVVFAVTAAFLGAFVWPKISKGLDDRAAKIREEISAAEAARQQAKEALTMYEQSLAQARAEAQKMLDRTKADQAAFAAELRLRADRELTELKEKARRDIEAAKRAALAEVYAEASNLATLAAGKILRRELNGADQSRLIEEAMGELQTLRN